MKEKHFRKNYERQLSVPRKYLEDVAFNNGRLDSNKFLEINYFLDEDQKRDIYKHHFTVLE